MIKYYVYCIGDYKAFVSGVRINEDELKGFIKYAFNIPYTNIMLYVKIKNRIV